MGLITYLGLITIRYLILVKSGTRRSRSVPFRKLYKSESTVALVSNCIGFFSSHTRPDATCMPNVFFSSAFDGDENAH